MSPKDQKGPIFLLDEESFMREVASRLNAFIDSCPDEADNLFNTFLEYQHELVAAHELFRGKTPPGAKSGIVVSHLLAALLQTPQGGGWALKPITIPDPKGQNPEGRFVRFLVVEIKQEGHSS